MNYVREPASHQTLPTRTGSQSPPQTPQSLSKIAVEWKPEPNFSPEPEPKSESHQVREPPSPSVPGGILVEYEGKRWSPDHTPATEGELRQVRTKLFE